MDGQRSLSNLVDTETQREVLLFYFTDVDRPVLFMYREFHKHKN